jgi:hypothetical protein
VIFYTCHHQALPDDPSDKILRIQEYSELLSIIGNKIESNCGLAVSQEIWETRPQIKEKLIDSLKEYIDFPKA